MSDAEEAQGEDGAEVSFEQVDDAAPATEGIQNPKLLEVPVMISVSVGNARLSFKELLDLTPDAILPLDSEIDDPVEIYIGERLIARGELVEAEEGKPTIGVRLTEICTDAA